jgi:hypothetical protein
MRKLESICTQPYLLNVNSFVKHAVVFFRYIIEKYIKKYLLTIMPEVIEYLKETSYDATFFQIETTF